jgi:hypothetical protein
VGRGAFQIHNASDGNGSTKNQCSSKPSASNAAKKVRDAWSKLPGIAAIAANETA